MRKAWYNLRSWKILSQKGSLFLLCISFLMGACQNTPEITDSTSILNLEELIESQIEFLSETNPEVEKIMVLNEKEDRVKTREINWSDELAYFLEADISKASLRDSYEIVNSDTLTETYRLREGQSHSVTEMEVLYSGKTGEVEKVVILVKKENRLFKISRELSLMMDGAKDQNRLLAYEIKGVQRQALSEDKYFTIKGSIHY